MKIPGQSKNLPGYSAFTLIELLVVIAIIGILASLILPALAKTKSKAQGIQCLSNIRQLSLAWHVYTDDNNDLLLFSSSDPPSARNPGAWVQGNLDFDPNNRSNWDVNEDIAQSPLWPYCGKSAAIWKCPADQSSVTVNGSRLPRVRSMSMNFWIGGYNGSDPGINGDSWRLYRKLNDFSDPGPSKTFVFLDVREDSIDSGNFYTDMTGWPDQPDQLGFLDFPASYHNRCCNFSFVDGHVESHRWQDPRTMPPLTRDGFITDWSRTPDNKDVSWLQDHATRKR